MPRHRVFGLGYALLFALIMDGPVPAQNIPAPPASPLTIFLTVSAPDNSPLTANSLRVTVDKKPVQALSLRPAQSDKLLFVLLVDTSASQAPYADAIRKTATRIFQQLASEGGVGYLGTFADRLHLGNAPLPGSDIPGALANIQFSGGTALYESIATCSRVLSRQAQPDSPRRVILVITDGNDNRSHIASHQAQEAAESEGIAIFSLNTSGRDDARTIEQADDQQNLNEISRDTGGAMMRPLDVDAAVASLLLALHHQWELTIAAPAAHDGKLHPLTVHTSQKHVHLSAPVQIQLP